MENQTVTAIIIVCVVVSILCIAWYVGKKEQVKKIVYSLVIEAERNYGTGTGEIKYEVVVGEINKLLPPPLGLIFTPRFIDGLIKDAVSYIKAKTLESSGETIEESLSKKSLK